jgi:hypothetical protein
VKAISRDKEWIVNHSQTFINFKFISCLCGCYRVYYKHRNGKERELKMLQVNVNESGKSTFKVISGVERTKNTRQSKERASVKYPFKTMAVDDCFEVEDKKAALRAQAAGSKAPYNVSVSCVPAKDMDNKLTGKYWVFLNGPKKEKTQAAA